MQWMRTVAIAVTLPALAIAQTRPADVTTRAAGSVRTVQLAELEFPWGMAYLPDGRLLITEKPGRLRVFGNGTISPPVQGLPPISYRESQTEQGGLLDVAVDPDFATNRTVYLSFTEEAPAPAGAKDPGDPRFGQYRDVSDTRFRGGAVARATFDGTRLSSVKVIWRQEPKFVGRGHFGHRLVFGRDGALFITSGDRMRFDPAQDPKSNLGKVVRVNRDGTGAEIWSTGHRNMLSAAVHPSTGQLWVFEMGPLGGDELNIIERGQNYGWPVVSNGDNYDKSPIPDHPTRPGFKAPVRTWTPVISPSGALFYDGSLFPWRGNVIVGGLSSMALIRLTPDGSNVTGEERLDMQRRIRDVIQAPDGAILAITDEKKGALLRITPTGGQERR